MTKNEADELVKRHVTELGEHFDAVVLLVTMKDGAETKAGYFGCGNWYARYGMAMEFVRDLDNRNLAVKVAEEMKGSQ
jgi:hypothetical protein